MMRPDLARFVVVLSLLTAGLCGCSSPKQPQAVDPLPPDRVVAPGSAEDNLLLTNVRANNALVEGTLVNNSSREVNDVHLLINHSFLWNNERNPGHNNPSRTEYYRVDRPIPAAGVMNFAYRPDPPLPSRPDGTFMTTVEVMGFSEISRVEVSQ